MSSLTGQQIQNSYQGLLKLADSSTGITNSFQSIEDGLGNNTGLRIATNLFESPNIPGFVPLKAQYYGLGFSNTNAQSFAANTQNVIMAIPFYDAGEYSYSAISFNIVNITSTSDVFDAAIYTSQMVNPNGLFPHTPIVSGITASTTSTGLKTFTFSSNISMSSYGGGIYWLVYKLTNSGVAPTVRFGPSVLVPATLGANLSFTYGLAASFTTLTYNSIPYRLNNSSNDNLVFSGATTFDNPYATTISSAQRTDQLNGRAPGFILHTVDY